MAEDKIDSYIDRNGVKGDTDFILSALNDVYRKFKDIEGIKVDMRGFDGLSKISPAMQQAKVGADSLAEATKTVEQRIAALNGHSKEFTAVLLAQTKAQTEAAKAQLLQAKAATENIKTKQAEAKSAADSAKAAEAEARIKAKAAADAAKAKAVDAKATEAAINDYMQLSKAYNDAALKYKNYALSLGEAHPITLQAQKDATDMYAVLKRLDGNVGQFQRNVGNYKSAFDGLGMSFSQVARELPSLTISVQQFALAISNNLPMVQDELKKATAEIAALKAEGKETPSLFQRITKSLLSPQVGLAVLITLFVSLAGKLFKAKSEAKTFNEELESLRMKTEELKKAIESMNRQLDYLKNLGSITVDINFGDDFTKTSLKAQQASVFLDQKISDLNDRLKEFKAISDSAFSAYLDNVSNATLQDIDRVFKGNLRAVTDGYISTLSTKDQRYVKAAKDAAKELYDYQIQLGDLEKERTLARANIRLINVEKEREDAENARKKREADAKAAKDEADKRLQIQTAIQVEILNRDLQTFKEIKENEKKSLEERLIALREYGAYKLQIINLQADTEKKIGNKTKEELLLIDTQRFTEQKELEKELIRERVKLINDFSNGFTAGQRKAYDELVKIAEDAYERFAKADKARTDKEAKEADKRLKKAEEEAKIKKQLQEQLTADLITLTYTLGTASIENEKNGIQDQIDLLEQKKQKDIEVANQTIANAQDRAAAIQIIEARANAQKEQLTQRQRELDIKKAQFDKARSIANIVQETAQNIVKYFGTPLALLAGAIGAVQLATVVAQPIPRYKHGKNVADLYEGPAIVDDGGKPEAIIRENGTVEIGGNTPRLTYVKSRDIVLPDANQLIDYVLAGNMGGRLAVASPKAPSSDKLERKLDDVVAAIKAQPKSEIKANEGGLTGVIRYGQTQIKYIGDQTNW